jgi:signal transduction histidine kinase
VIRPQPLRRIPSIKAKIGLLIVLAIGCAVAMSIIGYRLGWPIWVRPLVACALSLALVEFLAHGLTSPLREMEHAAARMASGDYAVRVDDRADDEVGRLATAFNTMAAELAEADRQRRDLVANASHELRTPIAGVQATLENLIDGIIPATPATLMAMHAQVDRMAHLVADLLDLSKLEAGAAPLRPAPVSLTELAHGVASDLKVSHPGLDVVVEAHPSARTGPDLTVTADGDRLAQVLTNLLTNAARYSARAVIELRALDTGATCIVVADDGPGIPPGEEGRVFERFYRADRARPSGGAGLGLAICRWIVELHGGTIHAEPNANHGCRMVVELPHDRRG